MPAPTAPSTSSATTPSPHGEHGAAPRRAGRLLAGGLAAAVALTAGITLAEQRSSDAAAASSAERAAATELIGELTTTRVALDQHARTADSAAAATLRHHAAVLAGGSHDPDAIADHVATLRTGADAMLEIAASQGPQRPGLVPVRDADPLLERVELLQEQAAELAAVLHTAADETEAFDRALAQTRSASSTYAEQASLTGSDEPAQVASAWRDELDLLAAYRDALDEVDTDATRTDVSPLLDAQHTFIDELEDVAQTAVALLDDGDLAGYAALLEERLGGDDLLGTADAVAEARERVTADLLDGPAADARARALGLRIELGVLRDLAPTLTSDGGPDA